MNIEQSGVCIFCNEKVVCLFPNSVPRSLCGECIERMEDEKREDEEEDGPPPDDE
jgi:hypothetical protein